MTWPTRVSKWQKKVTALKVPIQEDSSRCDYVTRKKLPGVFAKMSAKWANLLQWEFWFNG